MKDEAMCGAIQSGINTRRRKYLSDE
jgi:hypothetical protein